MLFYNDGNDYLVHHGILGMKWGVRRYQPYPSGYSGSGREVGEARKATLRTKIRAKRDAKEYARAKMYYGEGAGNRRKLIKATVEQRSKNEYGYKDYFDRYSQKQDMSKHAAAAVRERHGKDTRMAIKRGMKKAVGLIGVAGTAGMFYVANKDTIDPMIDNGKRYVRRFVNKRF